MGKTWEGFLKEKGHDTIDGLSAGEMAKLHNEFSEERNKALKDLIESKASPEDIAKATLKAEEQRAEEVKAIYAAMKEISLSIRNMNQAKGPVNITLSDQLKENKEKITTLAKKMDSGDGEVELKALTNRASVSGNTQAFDIADIGQLAHDKLTTFDIFPKIPITSSNHNGVVRYWDWDDATTIRAAAMVAEGGVFPESTAKWIERTIDIKKIGDTLPVTEEFLEDEAMFAAELNMFLTTNVDIIANGQVLNGDGTGNNLTGLVTSATAFVAAASGIADASIYDLIVKVSEDITDGGGAKYMPNFVVMNIADINKMKLKKDLNNNYIIPPFVSRDGTVVAGITVIEDNATVANTMVLGDTRFGRIYEIGGITLSRGTVNAQFTSDMMTIKARKRLAFLIRGADAGGFRSVASISAALVTLAL